MDLELIPKIFDKKTVMKNVRESRLEYMYHRGLISESEYIAGSRYRRLCELSQLGGGASKYEPRLDVNADALMDTKVGAFSILAKIAEEIPSNLIDILKYFCYQNFGVTEISRILNLSMRRTSARLHEALSRLAIYFGYIKVRNTIRGQGVAKKMEIQKISTVGR